MIVNGTFKLRSPTVQAVVFTNFDIALGCVTTFVMGSVTAAGVPTNAIVHERTLS
jgi:hypothetical protein